MTSGDAQAIGELSLAGAKILLKLYSTGKPLVAACTGHAYTIGALWLLACDTRIGEQGAYKFSMIETAMGMVLPCLLYTSPSPRDTSSSRMPSSA